MYDCIVLAGGGEKSAEVLGKKASSKGAVPILNKPMVGYVLEAVKGVSLVNRLLYIGDTSVLSKLEISIHYSYPDTGSIFENLIKGLEFFQNDNQVLVVTSDIPLIRSYMIEDFLSRCSSDAVFCYSFVKKEDSEKLFPKAHRTYIRLKEGSFTGGNIVLLSPSCILKNRNLLYSVISNRKNPFNLAKVIGWGIMIRFIFGSVDIPTLELKASKILGGRAQAVPVAYPEVGFDIDNEIQLIFVEEKLGKQTL
ncbi:MAG: NTP transferase domain-containing protein [bacterium]